MSDDSDLIRLFAAEPVLPADEAFVAGVTTRIAWRKRFAFAVPLGAAALLLLAIWATWPAAYTFSDNVLAGLSLMTESLGAFSNSLAGMVAAGALLLATALWSWLNEQLRGRAL